MESNVTSVETRSAKKPYIPLCMQSTERIDEQRLACLRCIRRLSEDFQSKIGFVPGNLPYLAEDLHERDTRLLEGAMLMIKGFFVWQSHVVEPTTEELELLHGYPAERTETNDDMVTWTPFRRLDGVPASFQDVHEVVLGDEVFRVNKHIDYRFPGKPADI